MHCKQVLSPLCPADAGRCGEPFGEAAPHLLCGTPASRSLTTEDRSVPPLPPLATARPPSSLRVGCLVREADHIKGASTFSTSSPLSPSRGPGIIYYLLSNNYLSRGLSAQTQASKHCRWTRRAKSEHGSTTRCCIVTANRYCEAPRRNPSRREESCIVVLALSVQTADWLQLYARGDQ